jgi:DNA-binding NarL/FixJ family response regulator
MADRLVVAVEPRSRRRELGDALAGEDVTVGTLADAAVRIVAGDGDGVRRAVRPSGPPVLALVARVDRRSATALLDAGAAGIALEGTDPGALARALHAVAAGFLVLPPAAAQSVRRPVLTARQQQILSLLVLGLANAEIAARLYLTESTVKTHVRAIYAKLGVRSRKEAIDVVRDPASGLGAGVLGMAATPEPSRGYTSPSVKR